MALSLSRVDVTSPASVAAASFSVTRRGYSQEEVREVLRELADQLSALQQQVRGLERELEEQRRRRPSAALPSDADALVELVGEETARVIQTAREAAAQIRARSEDEASRLVTSAHADAERIRADARDEAGRLRSDATVDAAAEVEYAKQQGREMVAEARAYREKVLADVARRRELARQQIEQLVHGRNRLVQAFERARLAAVDVLEDLQRPEAMDEDVNLDPTTGPVPLIVARVPSPAPQEAPVRFEPARTEAVTPVEPSAPVPGADVVEELAAPAEEAAVAPTEEAAEVPVGEVVEVPVGDFAEVPVGDFAEVPVGEVGEVPVGDFAEEDDHHAAASAASAVDDLFARIRASRTADVAERVAHGPAPDTATVAPVAGTDPVGSAAAEAPAAETGVDTAAPVAPVDDEVAAPAERPTFAARDQVLIPLAATVARRMKRVLADEQNDVMDRLRRARETATVDDLVPSLDAHVALYRDAVADDVREAARAGAASLAAGAGPTVDVERVVGAVRATLADAVVAPLRDRLGRCVADAGGDADALTSLVRAMYREWKVQHLDALATDVVHQAYGLGAFAALRPGERVCWLVDPEGPACPDADDNALSPPVAAGDPFPTGHTHPPAHPGCRCALGRLPG
jgi:DivIVA domain-containing protein